MEETIKLSNAEVPLSLHRARVIHSNKYTEASGGLMNLPVQSTLYTDVVFRLQDTGEDYKLYVRDLNLPLYRDQEVSLICAGPAVVGYIDLQSNEYYYTSRDFAETLGLGFPRLWAWIGGLLGCVILYLLLPQKQSAWIFAPLVAMLLFYYVQKGWLNYRIRRSIDRFLA